MTTTPTAPPIPATPPGLSDEAAALWADWHAAAAEDGLILDARETAVLGQACEHLTLLARVAAEIEELPALVVLVGKTPKTHPLVSSADTMRRTVSALLASIKPPPDRSTIGRDNVARRYGR